MSSTRQLFSEEIKTHPIEFQKHAWRRRVIPEALLRTAIPELPHVNGANLIVLGFLVEITIDHVPTRLRVHVSCKIKPSKYDAILCLRVSNATNVR